eukprot:TRINITY_DN12831_c0_g1_i4.p1 TRINITY_DN12831_c0_g1~~TRINITY_DN12831_c0_g1_i4.p1  ORF type:complete len:579 (-),score=125.70 TRINITY_DN12831_c0_g1_i4:149-1885(-)
MAVSAFRSTSKRGSLGASTTTISSTKENNTEELGKKIPPRRSRSVSALSRTSYEKSSSSAASNILEFSNKRDNPLFCSSSPSPPDELESKPMVGISKSSANATNIIDSVNKSTRASVSDSRRGRSVTRSSDLSNQFLGHRKEVGRSLSRVDTGRRPRSVSRGHYGSRESEVINDCSSAANLRNKRIGNVVGSGQSNSSGLSKQTRILQTWMSRSPLSESSDGSVACVQDLNWEDVRSTSSYSEAEEKTIKAVFEQMKSSQSDHVASDAGGGGIYETVRSEVRRAVSEIRTDLENAIRRNNPSVITTTNIADIPPESVNPDAIELVSDIRREYATKLEQSQERARKLRADLAVEELRGEELGRILKEILPDPKTPETLKSRQRRKTSIERRKMSKRLTEEAMNFFDECVSISTFDSSDFSAPEDPPFGSVLAADPACGSGIFPCHSSSASTTYCSNDHLNHNKEIDNEAQCLISHEDYNPTAESSTAKEALSGSSTLCGSAHFSSAQKPVETDGFHDIRNFIRKFEKEFQKDGLEIARSSYNADDYDLRLSAESLVFDKVIYKNRIVSGGLLLCHFSIS